MDSAVDPGSHTDTIEEPRLSWKFTYTQWWLGLGTYVFSLPYLRRAHGMHRLLPSQRYLFVANHVSLLDTLLLGGLCWRSGCLPILTLGDKRTWQASKVRSILSSKVGFLLDRDKSNPNRMGELRAFGRAGRNFHLLVFPEGTRGDGHNVGPCRSGIFVIAHEARLPIVPVFIENMELVSTKGGQFHLFGGLSKIEVHFGEAIAPEQYLDLPREEFLNFLRSTIAETRQAR